MDDWRQAETDEEDPAGDEVEFGPELTGERSADRMTRAMARVVRLLEEAEADGLDWQLHRQWQNKMEKLDDAAEVEKFADFLEAA